jgi:putative aldouronate transport system substrate-binding protein
MKKWISLVTAIVMLCTMVVAASAEEASTLKVLFYTNSLTKDVNSLAYIQNMAKDANVTLDIEQISSGWSEIKSTLLASGDIPDLIIGANAITNSDIAQFKDMFADMSGMIDEYAPNIRAAFNAHPELAYLATSDDGSIYGIPKYQRFWPKTYLRQMINTSWLKKLGLSVPTTLDELYDVLLAFKDNDCDGDGDPNNEIPMDFAAGVASGSIYQIPWALCMLCGYGVPVTAITDQGWYLDDGQVKNIYVSDEYYDLMQFLNKCWNAGLISKEIFTQDYATYAATSRKGIVGYTFGWDITDRMGSADLVDQYQVIAPIVPSKDYADKAVWETSYYTLNYYSPTAVMSAACQNKEAAMRFLNLFYSDEYGMQELFGSMGECISDNGDGTYTVLPPADTSIDPGTWKWTNAQADGGCMYINDNLKLTLPTDMQLINTLDETYTDYVARVGKDMWPGTFLKYNDEDNSNLSFYMTDLKSLFETNFASWIANGVDEATWQAYLKSANSAGYQDARQIVQTAVDNYFAYINK